MARSRGLVKTVTSVQVAQSEADNLRMELAAAQTNEAALRSNLDETEGQVWCQVILSTFYEETE